MTPRTYIYALSPARRRTVATLAGLPRLELPIDADLYARFLACEPHRQGEVLSRLMTALDQELWQEVGHEMGAEDPLTLDRGRKEDGHDDDPGITRTVSVTRAHAGAVGWQLPGAGAAGHAPDPGRTADGTLDAPDAPGDGIGDPGTTA